MNKLKQHLRTTLTAVALWSIGFGIAGASVINVSLTPANWELDPYRTGLGQQSGNGVVTSITEGLQVIDSVAHPGSPLGTYVRTVGSYDVQNATVRYKWKAINAPSYANFWNGHDKWAIGSGLTTGWSFNSSTVISQNIWIYTQAYVGTDLSWYYNHSYTGYSNQGGFKSGSGVTTNQAWVDSLVDVHFTASVNDNRDAGAGFVIGEMSLNTPDQGSAPGQVPEPATVFLLCSGLVGLASARVRRKKK